MVISGLFAFQHNCVFFFEILDFLVAWLSWVREGLERTDAREADFPSLFVPVETFDCGWRPCSERKGGR